MIVPKISTYYRNNVLDDDCEVDDIVKSRDTTKMHMTGLPYKFDLANPYADFKKLQIKGDKHVNHSDVKFTMIDPLLTYFGTTGGKKKPLMRQSRILPKPSKYVDEDLAKD